MLEPILLGSAQADQSPPPKSSAASRTACAQPKPLEDFYVKAAAADGGRQARCKPCAREGRAWATP
jgi:hypothetical protein